MLVMPERFFLWTVVSRFLSVTRMSMLLMPVCATVWGSVDYLGGVTLPVLLVLTGMSMLLVPSLRDRFGGRWTSIVWLLPGFLRW